MIQDLVNIFASELEQYSEEKEKTYNFWKLLRNSNKDYYNNYTEEYRDFDDFLLEIYGVKIYRNQRNDILEKFDIVNEHSFLMFKIKYA